MNLLGLDIGGTKCAVMTGLYENGEMKLLEKQKYPTDRNVSPKEMLERLCRAADSMMGSWKPDAVGISCGGPLDAGKGLILSPPNLPGWDNVPVAELLGNRYGVTAKLQNDANACAVAEWKFGAGKGCDSLIFLTFGTGLGAGLVLNGRLYVGATGSAGEAGHIRLADLGPSGYGKAGSFEGFCSGGGLAQLGYLRALEKIQRGEKRPLYYPAGAGPEAVSAKSLEDAARRGDETALMVYRECGRYLGKGIAVLLDLFNPQRVIIGSIFARAQDLLEDSMNETIRREALPAAISCCQVVPAGLGEEIGDYAALGVALL